MKTLGIIVAVPVVGFLLLFQMGMFAANGFWVGVVWLLFQLAMLSPLLIKRWRKRQKRHADITSRAHYEHAALVRGDMATGIYGAYQPHC